MKQRVRLGPSLLLIYTKVIEAGPAWCWADHGADIAKLLIGEPLHRSVQGKSVRSVKHSIPMISVWLLHACALPEKISTAPFKQYANTL